MNNFKKVFKNILGHKLTQKTRNLINLSRELRLEFNSGLVRFRHLLNPKPEVFTTKEFQERDKWNSFKEEYETIANTLNKNLDFMTVLDVGCGNGFLIKPLLLMGYNVKGIEISKDVYDVVSDNLKDLITIGDFSMINGQYELICCIEVAEHIEPRRSKELVRSLTEASTKYIFFTAAPPGQDGHGHINCRPHRHWIKWFNEEGWRIDNSYNLISKDLKQLKIARYLRSNFMIFSKIN